nr:unnamed protein product [Callosobruchus chinensis]
MMANRKAYGIVSFTSTQKEFTIKALQT